MKYHSLFQSTDFNIAQGSSDKELILEYKNPSALPIGIDKEATFAATYPLDPLINFCIYDINCYTDPADIGVKKSTDDGNFNPLTDNVEAFGIVEYHCGNASGFDFGSHVQDVVHFECSGYNIWNRSLTLEPCVCKHLIFTLLDYNCAKLIFNITSYNLQLSTLSRIPEQFLTFKTI